MQWLNGTYAAWFNRRYKRSGHLLGGRFHAFIVEKEAYYLELLRYVVLNPVRAKIVARPEEYRWSSYGAMAGYEPAPEWLTVSELAGFFGPAEDWRGNFRAYVDEAAWVLGRWDLAGPKEASGGIFTLVMRRIDGAWLVVHDHTSADSPE